MPILRSLSWKLTLAFLLVAFTTAGLVALSIRLTSAVRLTQLIVDQQRSSLEQSLSSYYATTGSWVGIEQSWGLIQFRSLPIPPGGEVGRPQAPDGSQTQRPIVGQSRGSFMGLADSQGTVIVPVDPSYPAGSLAPAEALKAGAPVTVNGQRVGTILIARQPPGFNTQEAQFLNRTSQALLYASLGAILVALGMGFLLTRTLTRPLKALTQAAQSITQGQLDQQVKVRSNDEIGQLAEAFNRMSQEVARVNQLRKQMTADIAHDLRTPLTVISGYVESMRDGVLKPTPQRLGLIYSEIERLQNLVGDLRMLSLADAGELPLNPQSLSPGVLLERAAALFRLQAEQKGVALVVEASPDLPEVRGDEARLIQVLSNLITNALRYTPAGGMVTLSAKVVDELLQICVEDTGEGIDPEELSNIFNRFHRADKSRHTEAGESGLGLAIVRALVESHGGTVSASSTPGQGTTIELNLPLLVL